MAHLLVGIHITLNCAVIKGIGMSLICLLFIVFSYFRIYEVYSYLYPLRIPRALGALSVIALTWHVLLARSINPTWPRELRFLGGFFALATLGTPLATNTK
jgi:hypothetical protein